jgi:hypothetical protein
VQQPLDLDTTSDQHGDAAEQFITDAAASGEPFFLYYANSHMHVPQNRHARWGNKSSTPWAVRENGGREFAASLLEMDNEVGRVMAAPKKADVDENTLVLVTGDNGPWECKCNLTGSHGPYLGQWQKDHGGGSSSKTTTWEGGHRVVGLVRWMGSIMPAVSPALASSMDYFATIAAITGLPLPSDRVYGGVDLSPVLGLAPAGTVLTPRAAPPTIAHKTLFHPLSGACGSGPLDAMRLVVENTGGGVARHYKAMWMTGGAPACFNAKAACVKHDPPLLFDLLVDEAAAHPLDTNSTELAAVVAQMKGLRVTSRCGTSTSARRITWLAIERPYQNSRRCRKQYARYANPHQRPGDHLVRIYAKLREATREAGVPILPGSLLGYSSPITARRQYPSADHVACDRQEGSGKLAIQLQIWRRDPSFFAKWEV